MDESKNILFNELNIITCDYSDATKYIIDSINSRMKTIYSHINLFNYYILQKKSSISEIIRSNSQMFFEGIGMKTGAWLLRQGWNSDTNGTDLFPILFNELSSQGKSVFLLGAEEAIIKQAINRIEKNFPLLKILGHHNGYFTENEEAEIVSSINSLNPDLLIIGMGMYKEIGFLNKFYGELNVSAIWNVGGLFDFISGKAHRAPSFVRKIRFEWLFRFISHPSKKFKRNFIIPFWFYFHILKIKRNQMSI
jgi:N-acetylglucosaminyldiphosphoundecaprenol N-acetyl-beta-D-mannosaminyltransferase